MTHVAASSDEQHGVRDDFVPKEDYISAEFAAREKQRLWPRVWQIACRLEEIPKVGDFVTYDIADESIIIVRAGADDVRAFYNACLHRGRKLTNGCGHANKLFCRYHGWTWKLDGSNETVVDREDWGAALTEEGLRLAGPKIDFWGGWVFINMDPNAAPLLDYLDPIPSVFKNYELEAMRYRWYKTVVLPCNWKVALEAFNEGYHVQTTHRQLLPFYDDMTASEAHGLHGTFFSPPDIRPTGMPSRRLDLPAPNDLRQGFYSFIDMNDRDLKAIVSERAHRAAQRVLEEVPAGASHMDVLMQFGAFTAEAAIREGAGYPNLTYEEVARAGTDWHVFPNHVFLPAPDAMLAYRARPYKNDPDRCIYDIWSLVRYAPDQVPPLKREFYENWQDHDGWGLILEQDFRNLADIQEGMKSRGFPGSRPSPVQERSVSNFHRVLRRYVLD